MYFKFSMNWNTPDESESRKYTYKNMLLPFNMNVLGKMLWKFSKKMAMKPQMIIASPLMISEYILEMPGKVN